MWTEHLVDAESGQDRGHCYHLTHVYRVGDTVIRVRVKRDSYELQSHAVAELLNAERTWTDLVSTPSEEWWPKSPLKLVDGKGMLQSVADVLFNRACAVLGIGFGATRT